MIDWIPVSERLPDRKVCGEEGCEFCSLGMCSNSVLALYKPGIIECGSRYQVCATAYFYSEYFNGSITHWMPLPPLPEEQ